MAYYQASTNANDIALIEVSEKLQCQQGKIWPACLPARGENYTGKDYVETTKSEMKYNSGNFVWERSKKGIHPFFPLMKELFILCLLHR